MAVGAGRGAAGPPADHRELRHRAGRRHLRAGRGPGRHRPAASDHVSDRSGDDAAPPAQSPRARRSAWPSPWPARCSSASGPRIQTTRVNLVTALKTTDADTTRRRRLTGRNLLVALQVALSLVLVSVSVWAFEVFGRAFAEGPGFRTSRMAKLTIDPSQARYSETRVDAILRARVGRRPAPPGRAGRHGHLGDAALLVRVRADRAGRLPPARGADERPLVLEQRRRGLLQDDGDSDRWRAAGCSSSDDAESARVAVVNETLARQYWPGGDAVGRRFQIDGEPGRAATSRGSRSSASRETSAYGYFAEPPQDMVYFPFRQVPRGNMVLLAQTAGDSASLLTPLREMVQRPRRRRSRLRRADDRGVLRGPRHDDRHGDDAPGRRHGPDGHDPHDGRALRAGLVLGQPAHARDRDPHRHRRDVGPRAAHDPRPGPAAGRRGPGGRPRAERRHDARARPRSSRSTSSTTRARSSSSCRCSSSSRCLRRSCPPGGRREWIRRWR